MNRLVTILAGAAAALGVLGAGAAQGQGKAPAAPAKAPDHRDIKAVEAWMAANRITNGASDGGNREWLLIGIEPAGVWLSRRLLDGSHNRGNKFTIVVNRLELFEPIVDGDRSILSLQFDYELDCLHNSQRRTVLTSYTRHNLLGKPITEKVNEPFRPIAAEPMMKSVMDDICRAIGG